MIGNVCFSPTTVHNISACAICAMLLLPLLDTTTEILFKATNTGHSEIIDYPNVNK